MLKRSKKFLISVIAAIIFSMPINADAANYSDDSSNFVVLSDVVPDIIQEIRYYSTYNFVSDRIKG